MSHSISFPDFEGRTVEAELESPDIDMVKWALSILVESTKILNEINLSAITGNSNSDECANGLMSELIKIACHALVREADIQFSELRREHDARAHAYRHQRNARVAELASRWNALAPINNLPVEVFSNILVFVTAVKGPNRQGEVLMSLATVGKYWKEVVFSTPQLWSRLHEYMPSKQLGLAIERSRSTPVDIMFDEVARYPMGIGCGRRERFIEAIHPLMQRWRTLDGQSVPQSTLNLLESNALILENICLIGKRWGDFDRFGLGIGAHLLSLELTRVDTDWSSVRIRGLMTLTLHDLPVNIAPSTAQLSRIIANSPELEELVLSDVGVHNSLDSDTLGAEPFPPLLRLKMLKLRNIPCTSYNYILSRLRFPNCVSIELQPDPPSTNDLHSYNSSDAYRHNTLTFVQQVRHALLTNEAIEVSLGRGDSRIAAHLRTLGWTQGQNIGGGNHSPGFSLVLRPAPVSILTFNPGAITEVVELAQQACSASTGIHLSVGLGLDRPDFPLESLTALNDSVVTLSLSGDADFRSVMWYIGQRQGSQIDGGDGEGTSWLFPRLTKIDLWASHGRLSVVTLRQMVQDRWVKYKDQGSEMRPEGSIEVRMPIRKGGKTEYWKPVVRKRKLGRKKAPVSEDESDDEVDREFQED
ncbi:hypothetical protein FRB98_006055 [Tulasnella sp. 332]|nr:hypothetical protein FRB98_006055 [Tulasnella sp. 332]